MEELYTEREREKRRGERGREGESCHKYTCKILFKLMFVLDQQ